MKVIRVVFLFLIFSLPAHALYVVDRKSHPLDIEQLMMARALYPEICLVKSGWCWGTGTLVAPRYVLTARHVIENRDDRDENGFWEYDRSKSYIKPIPTEISVIFEEEERAVHDVHVFKDGRLDIALLTLEAPVDYLLPRPIRAVTLGEKIRNITLVGYGEGRIICDWESYRPEKAYKLLESAYYQAYGETINKLPTLRFYEALPGERRVKRTRRGDILDCLEIIIRSQFARLGSGDSGGPLFNEEGEVIGIAHSSVKDHEGMSNLDDPVLFQDHNKPQKYITSIIAFEIMMAVMTYAAFTELNCQDILTSSFYTTLFTHLLSEITLWSDAPSRYAFLCMKTRYHVFHQLVKQQDGRVLKKVKQSNRRFNSTYLAISPQTKNWIMQIIKKGK